MDTFYIRHTEIMGIDQDARDYIWKEQKIAIHFPNLKDGALEPNHDNASLNPDDYCGSGRKAIRILNRLAEEGGYVLAEHAGQDSCMIGVVEPKSTIEIYKCKWGDRYKERLGREAILKTLKLSRYKIVSPNSAAKLLVGRPRQGTIMRWPNAHDIIKNQIEGISTAPSIRDLVPTFQEVLCSEFLRYHSETVLPRIAHLILPVGRTMRDVDILGIDVEGKKIVAQVTMQPSIYCEWKVAPLKKFHGDGATLIFFCDDASYELRDGIIYYPLKLVFEKFTQTTSGRKWLDEVLR